MDSGAEEHDLNSQLGHFPLQLRDYTGCPLAGVMRTSCLDQPQQPLHMSGISAPTLLAPPLRSATALPAAHVVVEGRRCCHCHRCNLLSRLAGLTIKSARAR